MSLSFNKDAIVVGFPSATHQYSASEIMRAFCASRPLDQLDREIQMFKEKDGWNDLGYYRGAYHAIKHLREKLFGILQWIILLCCCRARVWSWMHHGGRYKPDLINKTKEYRPSINDLNVILKAANDVRILAERDDKRDEKNVGGVTGKNAVSVKVVVEGVDFICSDKFLGSGSYGDVFEAIYPLPDSDSDSPPTREELLDPSTFTANAAFKRWKNGTGLSLDDFRREAELLESLRHDNILDIKGICHTVPGILTELMDGNLGELVRYVGQHASGVFYLQPGVPLAIALKIAGALEHMHNNSILHRDLKSDNIFISHDLERIKVGDFGTCRMIHIVASATTVVGTPRFMAPELALNAHMPVHERYTKSVDVWSYACLLFEMISGRFPWALEMEQKKLTEASIKGRQFWEEDVYTQDIRPSLSDEQIKAIESDPDSDSSILYELMQLCWIGEPTSRPSMADVVKCLKVGKRSAVDDLRRQLQSSSSGAMSDTELVQHQDAEQGHVVDKEDSPSSSSSSHQQHAPPNQGEAEPRSKRAKTEHNAKHDQ